MFAYYLNKNYQEIVSLFRSYENHGMSMALWGAGINGGVFLRFLQNHGLEVSEVVDKDEKKWGRRIGGYKIKKPKEVLGKVEVVLVCTFELYIEVAKELENQRIDVINLEDIVERV